MNTLIYKLVPADTVVYEDPPAIEFESEHATLRLANGVLTCTMKSHFSVPDDARAQVEPLLRAWEVSADIRSNRGAVRFEFDTANVTDRTPPRPGEPNAVTIFAQSIVAVGSVGTPTVRVTLNSYPARLHGFRLGVDAESIWLRYLGYLSRREPLPSMAYFCLTVLEALAGGRSEAAAKYRISATVLSNLGRLSSERGDRLSARKARHDQIPLTGRETVWVEAAIKAIVIRVGMCDEAQDLPWIDMADLPSLTG